MKRFISVSLALTLVLCSPGWEATKALAAVAGSKTNPTPSHSPAAVWSLQFPMGEPLDALHLTPLRLMEGSVSTPETTIHNLSPLKATLETPIAVQNDSKQSKGGIPPSKADLSATGKELDQNPSDDSSESNSAIASSSFDGTSKRKNLEDIQEKTLVVFGGAVMGRSWLVNEPPRVAKKLGMKLLMVDEEARRPAPEQIPPENFVTAETTDHSKETMERIAEQIRNTLIESGQTAVGAVTFFNSFVELAAMTRDALRPHFPGILGDSFDAVHAANKKHLARKLLARNAPDVSVPFEEIHSAQEAREAFVRITGNKPEQKVVIKLTQSAGKLGLRTEISTPQEASAVYEDVAKRLEKFLENNPDLAGLHTVDQRPAIMMEGQVEGPEVDVEMVLGPYEGFAMVAGNPLPTPIYRQEKGFTLPSRLSESIQADAIATAIRGLKATGLRYGNFHVEMKYTADGWKIIEFNTRMGGGELFPVTQAMFGDSFSLVEKGVHAIVGLSVEPPVEQKYPILLSRILVPQYSGRIIALEGWEELESAPGVLRNASKKKKTAGDRIIAPQDGYADDEFGYVVVTGKDYQEAMTRALSAMAKVRITIEQKDGSTVVQSGAYGHRMDDEVEGDPYATTVRPHKTIRGGDISSSPGVLARLWEAFKRLPSSFKSYLSASGLLAASSEGAGILYAVYGISQFGLLAGMLSQAINILFRIPGSLYAAKWIDKFDTVKIYKATTIIQAGLLAGLFLGAQFLGGTSIYLALYFFNQVIGGLIYGATRGMAENKILPELVGQDRKRLETAGFIFMGVIEGAALLAAFLLSPWLRAAFGANIAILAYAAIMLASLYFTNRIRPSSAPQTPKSEPGTSASGITSKPGTLDKLPVREYIPYILASFLHFSFYSLFAVLFAKYTLMNEYLTDYQIGLYDAGSLVISVLLAIPTLLAAHGMTLRSPPGKKTISLTTWFGALALVAIVYLMGGTLASAVTGLIAAAIMGVLITVNRIKWMAAYINQLKIEHHAKMAATVNSIATLLSLLPFAAISIGTALGMSIMPLLIGTIGVISATLILGWLLTKQPDPQEIHNPSRK